jgi:hypothetical protein
MRMHPDVVSAMRKRELTVASFPESIEPNPDATDMRVNAVQKRRTDLDSRTWA